jgi:biotin synthase
MAGANSIFAGEKLLTTPNPSFDDDMKMFNMLGLKPREAFKEEVRSEKCALSPVGEVAVGKAENE